MARLSKILPSHGKINSKQRDAALKKIHKSANKFYAAEKFSLDAFGIAVENLVGV